MEKEYLLKKWLDNDLTQAEEKVFKKLNEYAFLVNVTKDLKKTTLKNNFNEDNEFFKLKEKIALKKNQKSKILSLKFITKIAAIFLLSVSSLFYITSKKNVSTLLGETKVFELPDNSKVTINALSTIKLKRFNWGRNIALTGEAYFEVEKGETFIVTTKIGTVKVLGTKFNVITRANYFETICYEGSVLVTYKEKEKILKPSESFLVIDDKIIKTKASKAITKIWNPNKSTFRNAPIKYVLEEFERHYKTKIIANFNTNELFTGSFIRNNESLAIKSITLPLNLKINKKNKSITLSKND